MAVDIIGVMDVLKRGIGVEHAVRVAARLGVQARHLLVLGGGGSAAPADLILEDKVCAAVRLIRGVRRDGRPPVVLRKCRSDRNGDPDDGKHDEDNDEHGALPDMFLGQLHLYRGFDPRILVRILPPAFHHRSEMPSASRNSPKTAPRKISPAIPPFLHAL